MKLFEAYALKDMILKNRVVMPPMCMYRANEEGISNAFHLTHYVTRAVGGVGLIIFEATAVSPEGRISDHDLGLWNDQQIRGLKDINAACKAYGAKTAIQLIHAGRKCAASVPEIFAPSALAFSSEYRLPQELTVAQIKEVVTAFKEAARRAHEADFDAIELHGAHGYLIHQFLSPLTNLRTDAYGGNTANRTRFLKEILAAVHTVWPKEKPILLRVSASDHQKDGIDLQEMIHIINEVKASIDMVHVSSGALLPIGVKSYPGYQVTFSEGIKSHCQIPTIAVGLITEASMVEEIISNGRADLVALGRELLRNPYWMLKVATQNNVEGYIQSSYESAF